jgi:hypothetical protein
VTDGEDRTLGPVDFEKLFELKQVSTLTLATTDPQPPSVIRRYRSSISMNFLTPQHGRHR